MRTDWEGLYRELRGYAFAIAYRMLGSVSEAEDVVQEAFIRLGRSDEPLRSDKAYIATITTRLALDSLHSARAQRETYVGPWLPEPLVGHSPDVGEAAELAESLSMALLVVLETLTPAERAVFVLHEVFGYDYREIAEVIGKSEINCRQLAARARRRVHDNKPRFDASRADRDRLAVRFFAACTGRDLDGLVQLLAGDAAFYGDGGAKGTGTSRPIFGRDNIARLLVAFFGTGQRLGIQHELIEVNGQPGAKFLDAQGRLVNVISLDIADGVIQTIRSVINPDKLAHLGELSPIGRRGGRASNRTGRAAANGS
jgi:RNA polymerase sigma-70 factor (ECF subfamily)